MSDDLTPRFCSQCGKPVGPGDLFCISCGARVAATPAQQAPAAGPATDSLPPKNTLRPLVSMLAVAGLAGAIVIAMVYLAPRLLPSGQTAGRPPGKPAAVSKPAQAPGVTPVATAPQARVQSPPAVTTRGSVITYGGPPSEPAGGQMTSELERMGGAAGGGTAGRAAVPAEAMPFDIRAIKATPEGLIRFRGLTPGHSTRADVKRVLGRLVGKQPPDARRVDHDMTTPAGDLARITVVYHLASDVVEAIEVEPRQGHPRQRYLEWFRLGQPSHAGVVVGRLVELYVPQGIALHYAQAQPSGPVAYWRHFDATLPPEAVGGSLDAQLNAPWESAGQPSGMEGVPLPPGLLVIAVAPDGAGARAGLLARDIVLSVDGTEYGKLAEFNKAILGRAPGSEVTLGILRQGRSRQIRVVLGALPPAEAYCRVAARLGNAQQYEQVARLMDKALPLAPDNAQVYLYRGWARTHTGDTAGGREDLTRAVQFDPNGPVGQEAKKLLETPPPKRNLGESSQ